MVTNSSEKTLFYGFRSGGRDESRKRNDSGLPNKSQSKFNDEHGKTVFLLRVRTLSLTGPNFRVETVNDKSIVDRLTT